MHLKFKRGHRHLLLLILILGVLSACAAPQPAATVPAAPEPEEEPAEAAPRPAITSQPQEPTATAPAAVDPARYDEYEIITLLAPDAIPAIDNPTFLTAEEAAETYEANELVIGVEFNGDARAYSIPHLSTHEIVNDTVGGVKIAVTW